MSSSSFDCSSFDCSSTVGVAPSPVDITTTCSGVGPGGTGCEVGGVVCITGSSAVVVLALLSVREIFCV